MATTRNPRARAAQNRAKRTPSAKPSRRLVDLTAQATQPAQSQLPSWVWRLAGLVLVIGGFAGCQSLLQAQDQTGSGAEAVVACRGFVRDLLKSPSTADFGQETHTGADPTYEVMGVVDSQNSFGATVRNTYTCTVTHSGGSWTLGSMTGLTE